MSNSAPFHVVRQGALVSGKARQYLLADDFSTRLRR
jgi:hypothetical protein